MSLLSLHVSCCNDWLVIVATVKHIDEVPCNFCICLKHTIFFCGNLKFNPKNPEAQYTVWQIINTSTKIVVKIENSGFIRWKCKLY